MASIYAIIHTISDNSDWSKDNRANGQSVHFQDRVVHHFFSHLGPVFEKVFTNDSYGCRKGKGTLYGVNRIYDFIYDGSEQYTKDAYILALDVQGYFYAIHKEILYKTIQIELLKQCASLQIDFDVLDYFIKIKEKAFSIFYLSFSLYSLYDKISLLFYRGLYRVKKNSICQNHRKEFATTPGSQQLPSF